MEKQTVIPGLNRNESDAATALGAFLLAMLAVLCTIVLALNFLSGLPSIMAYGILFAVMVFGIVCGAVFMKTDIQAPRTGPPQLQFRNPPRRRAQRVKRTA